MKNFTILCSAIMASLFMFSCTDHISFPEDAQPVSLSSKLEASTMDRVQEIALAAPAQFPSVNATKADEKKIAEIIPFSSTKWAKTAMEMNDGMELLAEAIDEIYIVNYADNDGYAIVSANQYMPEVLALIDSGNYKEGAEVPGGFEIFMERLPFYAMQQLKEAEPKALTRSGDVPDTIPDPDGYVRLNFREETVLDDYASVGTVLKTEWGQGNPYNYESCVNAGALVRVGCVPIAMGQIMGFHQYPTHVTFNSQSNVYIPWLTITPVAYPAFQSDMTAVSLLLAQIGFYANTNYGNGSYTNLYDAITAFQSFGYNTSTLLPYDYDAIFSSLSTYGPVIVAGTDTSSFGMDAAHAWVVDASYYRSYSYYKKADLYDEFSNYCGVEIQMERHWTNKYVHCNWGDYGTGNGYYSSGFFAFTDSNNISYNYNSGISMIINIHR